MKAHILQPYANADWPLVRHFQERWPDATVHCGSMPSLRYRTKLGFLVQLPRLFMFGFRIGMQALEGDAAPAAFVVGTDPEVLALALACWLRRKRVPIFLVGFIYTRRKSALASALRRAYFRAVLSLVRGVVCHSMLETERYAALFALGHTAFRAVPFALNVDRPPTLVVREGGYALSAGRAERDYRLLCEAWDSLGLDLDLHIVCDVSAALESVREGPKVRLLRQCFDLAYIREIAEADFVVIPVKDKELSAGQMVLLQSMAMGKAVIITRTPTTEEYGEHLKTLYFVEHGSADALRHAVLELTRNPQLRADIGAAARQRYEQRHTVSAYTNGILAAVEDMLASPRA